MSRIPRGIPSVTYCRVVSSVHSHGQGDVISDGNSITILEPGKPSSRHEVAQVLERGISDEEVCELTFGSRAGSGIGASLNPITAFVSDAATAIIFIVGSKETRKWQFLKRTVLPFVANEIFANIAEKDQQLAGSYYKAQINLSAFELQDEVITDLLRPVNRGMPLTVTAEEGVKVQGLQSETIVDEMDLRRLLLDACDNRATHTLPPGGSIDTSSAIFEFTLFQSESPGEMSSGATRECHSRLLVVEVPSTDPLVQGEASEVRQLEGPLLHKSLLTFLDVAKKLNTPTRAAIAPFRSSKLTHYLSELLGGNAIVVAIGLLANGEPLVSRRTLEMIGALNNAVHYPVGGRELTDVLQGLLGKYRAMLVQLQDELALRWQDSSGAKQQEMELEQKLLQLQKQVSESVMERNGAVEDRERMYEMAELLRAKYAALMQEKAAQSEELAQSQEDNVTLAKTLIDKNLEFAAHKEQAEKEAFELNTQLLAARSRVEELEAEIQAMRDQQETLRAEAVQREQDAEVLRGEIATLKGVVAEKEQLLQTEREKNLELGAELLTLVNRRDLLQKELEELGERHASVSSQLRDKTTQEEEIMEQLQQVQRALRSKEEELFEAMKHSAAVELEAKETKLAADQLVLECREKMLDKGTTLEAAVGAGGLPKYEELQTKVRKGAKVIRELEKELRRAQADLVDATRTAEARDKELQVVRDKYRSKLSDLLLQDGDAAAAAYHHQHAKVHHRRNSRTTRTKGHDAELVAAQKEAEESFSEHHGHPRNAHEHHENHNSGHGHQHHHSKNQEHSSKGGPLAAAAQVQQQLLESYSNREEQQRLQLEDSLQRRAALTASYRELYDKYLATLELVEEEMPRTSVAKMKPLAEHLQVAQADLAKGEAYLEELDSQDRLEQRQRAEEREQARVMQSERLSLILATYKHNLESTERRLVAVQQENIDLHIQIKQLVENSKRFKYDKMDKARPALDEEDSRDPGDPASGGEVGGLHSARQALLGSPVAVGATLALTETDKAGAQQQQQREYSALVTALSEKVKELKAELAAKEVLGGGTGADAAVGKPPSSSRSSRSSSGRHAQNLVPPLALDLAQQGQQGQQAQTPLPPPAAATEAHFDNPHNFQSMAECLRYISSLEAGAGAALGSRLRQAEQRATQLGARNAALEEELSSYQQYMRDVVPQYKKQLQFLKQQLTLKLTGAKDTSAPDKADVDFGASASRGTPGSPLRIADGAEVSDIKLPVIMSKAAK